jgi:hypothetical protein
MSTLLLQPDLVLSEHAAAIEQRLDDCTRRLSPEDLEGLLGDAGRELVAVTIAALAADSASIWLVDAERTRMIVSHTEPRGDLLGWEQPLEEGLISLVFASEQSICENQVYEHVQHSKRIDNALDKVTCAMIAVPFYVGGHLRGVLTCVRLKDSIEEPDPDGFTAADLGRVRRLSMAIERLLNYRILTALLGLEI